LACIQGDEAIVNALATCTGRHHLDLADAENMTALYHAAVRGHLGVVTMLLKHGADARIASQSGTTPLLVAAEQGLTEMVRELLFSVDRSSARICYVNAGNDTLTTPLHQAGLLGI
jgi:ankyrin repeat protein